MAGRGSAGDPEGERDGDDGLTARDVMSSDVRTVGPEMLLFDLERAPIEEGLPAGRPGP